MAELLTRLDLPLAHDPAAESLIEAIASGYDCHYHLTTLDFPGGQFHITGDHPAPGHKARLRVQARDVSLALSRAEDTSILNLFPASVTELAEEPPARVLVRLDLAGSPLLARITRRSADRLGLEVGRQVYAQVKSVALMG